MRNKHYMWLGLFFLLMVQEISTPLSAQEDDREDMLLIITSVYNTVVDLHRVSLDGNFSQLLGEVYNPARTSDPSWLISPDREWIFYQDLDQRLHRIRVNGADGWQLTEEPATPLTWSPDGRWLVFRQCDTTCDLYAMDWTAEDLTYERLTYLEANTINIDRRSWNNLKPDVWSPNGQWLVFSAGSSDESDLYRLNIGEPSQVQQVTDLPGRERSLGWSGDGQWLVFLAIASDHLYSLPMGDAMITPAGATRMTTESCSRTFYDWSQDHQWLIFSTSQCENYSPDTLNGLYLGNAPELVQFAEIQPVWPQLDWIAENEEFVFSNSDHLLNIKLNAAEPSASTTTVICESSYYGNIAYSSDKEWVYFTGKPLDISDDMPMDVYRMHPDGTGAELLFDLEFDESSSYVQIQEETVDEQWLIVKTVERPDGEENDSVGVYMVRSDGSASHPVIEWENIKYEDIVVIVSPDGQWLYFQDRSGISVRPWYLIHLDSPMQEEYQIQPMTLPDGFYWGELGVHSWSSDGQWITWYGEVGYTEWNGITPMIFRSPVGNPELQFIHFGQLVGRIYASR